MYNTCISMYNKQAKAKIYTQDSFLFFKTSLCEMYINMYNVHVYVRIPFKAAREKGRLFSSKLGDGCSKGHC